MTSSTLSDHGLVRLRTVMTDHVRRGAPPGRDAIFTDFWNCVAEC
jgi:hypothetical protein